MVELSKILPVILILLVLVSAVQAFQLNSMKEKLESGKVSVTKGAIPAGNTNGNAEASSGASLPADIGNLPSMVGGC